MARIIQTADLRPGDIFDPDTTAWIYNGLDICVTAEVFGHLEPLLDNQTREVYELEKALQGPVLDMNMHGLLVDKAELAVLRGDIEKTRQRLEDQLNYLLKEGYGVDISWGSPQQVGWFLYDYLRLPIQRKRNSKGGFSPTTDRKALEKLKFYQTAAPFINHVLALRDLRKRSGFLNTELDSDGYIRSNFNIAGTNSGRLSSSHSDFGTGTNLQNIDRLLRQIFIAHKGKKIACLDLEQADSRNMGALCWNYFLTSHGPEFAGTYLDACESGDLHTMVTRMSRPELDWPDDPTLWKEFADKKQDFLRGKSYRDTSKNWGHGSNYLLTAASAANKIPGATIASAEEFKRKYFTAFPCIPELHKALWKELKEYACLNTLFGRRRYFFGRLDDEKTHREAVAYCGQGSTADEINRGLLWLWRLGRKFPGFQLLLQVHDSVYFEYDEECEDEIIPWAKEVLRVPTHLFGDRPFVVPTDAKVGWNMGDFNDDPKEGKINLDGQKKWKEGDSRQRLVQPRLTAFG